MALCLSKHGDNFALPWKLAISVTSEQEMEDWNSLETVRGEFFIYKMYIKDNMGRKFRFRAVYSYLTYKIEWLQFYCVKQRQLRILGELDKVLRTYRHIY
jgi:hypothetical protein